MAEESMPTPNDTLVSTSHSLDITHKRLWNQRSPINKIPSELLSDIFGLGEVEERATRQRDKNYFTVQEVATKVCHHWRNVAIKNPLLWTYIHITRPPPNPLAVLFLERAGPSTPLEIDIELRLRYCKAFGISTSAWRSQLTLMSELLEFLSSNGAGAWRWRSLDVSCKQAEVLINIIEYLSIGTPALLLQFLRLKQQDIDMYLGTQERYLSYPDDFVNKLCKICPTLPSLRSIEFHQVPWRFILERPLPLVAGLTKLDLTSSTADPSYLTGLKDLLMASPMLEEISVDSIFKESGNIAEFPRVQLPYLQSLAVGGESHPFSTLSILWMIQAPNLRTFFLFRSKLPMFIDNTTEIVGTGQVLLHIYTGHLPGGMSDNLESDGPRYPKLRDLNISEIGIYDNVLTKHAERLLFCFPSVTRLTIYVEQAMLLFQEHEIEPCPLPDLVHLKVSSGYGSYSDLVRMLQLRGEAGRSIQTIELPTMLRKEVMEINPSCIILFHEAEPDTNYSSSLSEMSVESEDEEDEDSDASEDEESDDESDDDGDPEDED